MLQDEGGDDKHGDAEVAFAVLIEISLRRARLRVRGTPALQTRIAVLKLVLCGCLY